MGSRSLFRISPPASNGSIVASGANGFASVLWDPNGTNCDCRHSQAGKHDFHPAYATSSEHTRVPGAAHTYNIVFSDEIGHFEYCSSVARSSVRARPSPGGIRSRDSMTSRAWTPGFSRRSVLLPHRRLHRWRRGLRRCALPEEHLAGLIQGPRSGCALPCGAGDLLQSVAHRTARVKRRISAALLSKATCRASSSAQPRRASDTCRTLRIRIRDRAASTRPRAQPSIRSSARGWMMDRLPVAGGWPVHPGNAGRFRRQLQSGVRAHSGDLLPGAGWSAAIHLRDLSPDSAAQPVPV